MQNCRHIKDIKSAYVHIPFCAKKCSYCSFTSFIAHNFKDKYVNALIKEIKHYYKNEKLNTLYVGGGTPSLLSIDQFKKIFSVFKFEPDAEITLEINPESTTLGLLHGLLNIGVNRISIGVQSFNDDILRNIGRLHSAKEAKDAAALAKEVGFKNINIDLIYGLPNQTIKDWENTLNEAIKLNTEHISLYGLKIEEGSVFAKKMPQNLPNEDIQADMYELAIKKLGNFYHYEISNFAKTPDYISKHNNTYWEMVPYYGFGLSASGFEYNDKHCADRYTNSLNFKEYTENPAAAKNYLHLSEQNILEETIFLGFRKTEGINIDYINKKFNIDFNSKYASIIKKYLESNHIVQTKNGYKLSDAGILISNYILCDFL